MADRYTLRETQAMLPRQPGESLWAYQQRLGSSQWNQAAAPMPNGAAAVFAAPSTAAPTPFPVAPAVKPPAGDTRTYNPWTPQQPDETYLQGGVRSLIGAAADRFMGGDDVSLVKRVMSAFSTPNEAKAAAAPAPRIQARQASAPGKAPAISGPINSYKDPRWQGMESDVEQLIGIPAGSLGLIRTRGERSNNDQTNHLGTASVYQITASTQQLLKKKYGWDPENKSPSNMAKGAALLLKEGIQRTGSLEGSVQQYHGGLDPRNYGPQNAAYMQRVFGDGSGSAATGVGSGLMNPFDPSYGNQAIAEINNAGQAMMTPVSAPIDHSEAPTLAAPIQAAPTDFSKAREALAATKPAEITEKEALQVRRDGWFAGLGQALAGLEDGAGLGKVLAAMGGGAMAGGAKGNDELRRRQDQFDEKLARYNVAVSNQEMGIAQQTHQELQHYADALNQHAVQQFTIANDRFFKDNFTSITPDGTAVLTSKVGPDGKGTLVRTPIKAAVMADMSIRRAQVYQSMGQQNNAARADVARATNGYIVGMAAQQAMTPSATPEDSTAANVAGMAAMAGDVVSTGRVASLFEGNEDAYKGMLKSAQTEVMQVSGLAPGQAGYDDAIQAAVQERVMREAIENPKFRAQLFANGGASRAVMEARRQAGAKTTVTRGPKGTTTREQY